MREYNNRDHKTNEEELDPCIAAEIRMKKAMFSTRTKKVLIGLILLLLFIVLLTIVLVALLMVYPKMKNHGIGKKAAITKRTTYINLKPSNKIYEPPSSEDSESEENQTPAPLEIRQELEPIKTTYIDLKPSNKRLEDAIIEEPNEPQNPSVGSPVRENEKFVLGDEYRPRTTSRPSPQPTIPPRRTTPVITDSVPSPSLSSSLLDQIYDFVDTGRDIKESCHDYLLAGYMKNGVYKMRVSGASDFPSLCIMEGGYGWNVLQRRSGMDLVFWNRTFDEYAHGFGVPTNDHWLGLEKVYAYVKGGHKLQLRIVLRHDMCSERSKCSGEGENGYWWGDWDFKIGDRSSKYKLTVLSILKGNLSDSSKDPLQWLNNEQPFTTIDSDNDKHRSYNCASHRHFGGWWHKDCTYVALNGESNDYSKPRGLHWTYQALGSSHGLKSGAIISYVIKPKYSLMLFRIKS